MPKRLLTVGASIFVLIFGCAGWAAQVKLPVPTDNAQIKAMALVRELYHPDTVTPDKRVALARTLGEKAVQTKDDPAAKYVMLLEAAHLAADAGGTVQAFEMVGEIGEDYALSDGQGDALTLEIFRAARRGIQTGEQGQEFVDCLAEEVDEAIGDDRYVYAQQVVNVGLMKFDGHFGAGWEQMRRMGLRVQKLVAAYPEALEAKRKLDLDGKDEDARGEWGRFLCYLKGDWEAGLPVLAGVRGVGEGGLAREDLAEPEDAGQQVAVGDGWWKVSEGESDPARQTIRLHAAALYRKAALGVSGVTADRIKARVEGLREAVADPREKAILTWPGEVASTQVASTQGASTQRAGGAQVVMGKAFTARQVDLLALVDVHRDGVAGVWQRRETGIISDDSKNALLQIPYKPPLEYDLRAEFWRTTKSAEVTFLLVHGETAFGWSMGLAGGKARFESINGRAEVGNKTVVKVAMEANRRYLCEVRVRNGGVEVALNGRVVGSVGDVYGEMSRYSKWQLKDAACLGLGCSNGAVKFARVDILELSGPGLVAGAVAEK